MTGYTLTTTLNRPYEDTVEQVRAALGAQEFGILTEIDLKATLKGKLGVDITPQIILGACRPPLAYEAIQAEPSIATVLPCNVVVRAESENSTVVEAFDPDAMMGLANSRALARVAQDAKEGLTAALAAFEEN